MESSQNMNMKGSEIYPAIRTRYGTGFTGNFNFKVVLQIVAFLDLLPTKSLDTFPRFVKSLEEDYDWLAFSLKNAQISPEQVQTYKLTQKNNNKHFGDTLQLTAGNSGTQARPPVCSGSGVANNCETMSVSQSSNSSGSQDDRDRRLDQERGDRMAGELRDRELRQERDRARYEQDRRSRMEMFERDRGRHEMSDRGFGYDRRQDILDRGHAQDRLGRPDYLDRVSGFDRGSAYDRVSGYDRHGRGFDQEPPRHEMFDRGSLHDRMDRCRQDTFHRSLSQERLERLGIAGFGRTGSPHSNRGFGSPLHSSSGGFGSPLHSSEFSLKSSESGEDRFDSMSQVGDGRRRQEMEGEITEEMIEFVMMNPRIMKRWYSLAHSAGLSHRVEVIKARIRSEGRDHDEHVGEFLREWAEQKPEAANLGGLINLLKGQKFNDTALKLEDGTFRKRRA